MSSVSHQPPASTASTPPAEPAGSSERAVANRIKGRAKRLGDTVFSTLATSSGVFILVVLAAVALFLITQSIPAFTTPTAKLPFGSFGPYVLPFVFGTLYSSFLALLMAVPVALGVALFISHYAPRRLAVALGYIVDLLAAVPSVVFGLWGINTLAPAVQPVYSWLTTHLGWFPLFAGPVSATGRTIFTAAIVLAVMVLPIITSITREVFRQTPALFEEASLALGATRWEMIRQAVLPFGRSGIISACMLGLGRALGETMAVAMVLSPAHLINWALFTSQNSNSIAANIALQFPEAYGVGSNQLIATGLVLFVITLGVNMTARWIIARRADFSGAN